MTEHKRILTTGHEVTFEERRSSFLVRVTRNGKLLSLSSFWSRLQACRYFFDACAAIYRRMGDG